MSFGFQRQTDLALAALRVLATHDALSGADLADEVGTTISYLPQVMSPLVKEGWVVSHRGPGGGYRITTAAHAASIRQVIDVTEGSTFVERCVMRDEPCRGAPECPIHDVWAQAREVLVKGLDALPAVAAQVIVED